jgi:hypothetical protein
LSTENIDSSPIKEVESSNPPKYSQRIEKLVGYDDCGGCINVEGFINGELKSNSDVPVTFTKIAADSAEGVAIVKDKKLKTVPYVEECLIPTDPTQKPECTEIIKNSSFKKSDFKYKVNS